MRTFKQRQKGSGLLNRIKGLFTRKKKAVTDTKAKPKTVFTVPKKPLYQQLKQTFTQKPITVYPIIEYPLFKTNKRRDSVIRKDNSQEYINYREEDYEDIRERVEDKTREIYKKNINLRTMSPVNANTPKNQVKTMSLPIEPFEDGMRRVFLYFYNRIKEVQNKPLSPNKLYASDDEINELIYFCKNYRYRLYPDLLKEYMTRDQIDIYTQGEDEMASNDLFKLPIDSLTKEIKKTENLDHVYPSYKDPNVFQFANEYGSYLGRYYPYLTRSLRQIIYANDKANGYNKAPPPLSFKGHNMNRPIAKTLNSYYSICCFIDQGHFSRFIEQGLKGCSHYILLNNKHFPNPMSFFSESMPVPITASKLLDMSFIQDAFKEQGVDTMDNDLFTLLQKEAPGLIETAKVTLATSSYFKELKLYDHFMILTEKALPEKLVVTYRNPLQLAVVRRAFDEDRQVLLVDPYTTYCTKKKNPGMWSKAFGEKREKFDKSGEIYWDPNLDTYLLLRDVEKFFVDFCQYQLVLSKYFDLTQNNRSLTVEERLLEASELYKLPFSSQKFIANMKEVVKSEPLFHAFKEMQTNIITYDHPIETLEDVNSLIEKFEKQKKTLEIRTPTMVTMPKTTTLATTKPEVTSRMATLFQNKPFVPNTNRTIKSNVQKKRNVLEQDTKKLNAQLRRNLQLAKNISRQRSLIKNHKTKKNILTKQIKELNALLQSPSLRTMA